jgi:hypothetical protein
MPPGLGAPVNWANVVEKLDAGLPPALDAYNARTTWLSTVCEVGSPHVTAIGALWLDGSFWFQSRSGTGRAATLEGYRRAGLALGGPGRRCC